MTEGSVIFVVKKLAEFLEEEGRRLSNVQSEAEYINDELEFMKNFLRVAEALEVSDTQLKLFAKKVREVVYEIEDILDVFKLRLAHSHGQGFLQQIFHYIKSLKVRHQIAFKMQDIKSRVEGISKTHRKYLIKNNITDQGLSSTSASQPSSRWLTFLVEETNDLVGIESPKSKLIDWLFEENSERELISVVGMGGLGKTTLVKEVYNDKEVKKHFQFHAWITLSLSFTVEDFIIDIVQQLSNVLRMADPPGLDSSHNVNLRMPIINEFLQERKYLIVFDNVSDAEYWGHFMHVLPNNKRGSRILLTTRTQHVASFASPPHKVYNLNPLSEKESQTLFHSKIFQNQPCPPSLKDVTQRILARCGGLPLAIVAISGVLATKQRNRIDEWEMVYRSLGGALEDDRLKGVLSLSYNDLPYYLKQCLLYFSIFPVGSRIEQARLVRLWIAEGFVEESGGRTLEEVAEAYLNELIKRSLVQVVEATSDGRVKTCRVQDILLEMIILKSNDQEFVTIANEQRMVWPKKVRRLSMHDVVPLLNMKQRLIASRLRSLLVFSGLEFKPESLGSDFPSRSLRLLNVLDLADTPLTKFPKKVLRLYLLKYLSLRNTKVNSIPNSIGNLQNLETLDLKHTYVTELPNEILKLQKLRHLLVYRYVLESDDQIHTKFGFKAPIQIGSLQSVQKLCFLEANQGKKLMEEVGKLNELRRLGIIKLRREDGEALCLSIEMLRNLRALSVTSVVETEIIDMDKLSSPPRFLQRLYLGGRLEKLPSWISSVDSLVKFILKWSRLSDDPLQLLQHLPNLVHLEFVEAYDGENLCFQAQGFQRLKFLGLNKLNKLENITIEQGAMPSLEMLIVQSCELLHTVPLGIEFLTELKVLEVFNMPLDLIMALHPNGGDYRKVQNVPEVYITNWRDSKWDIISLESFKEGQSSAQAAPKLIQRPRHIWK